MISQRGMAGWGEQIPGSAATYRQLVWGRSRPKFLPPAPNKVSAGLPSRCICLLGEKKGPEFNYLLFPGAALRDYHGARRAFGCVRRCYPSPEEKKDLGLNKL